MAADQTLLEVAAVLNEKADANPVSPEVSAEEVCSVADMAVTVVQDRPKLDFDSQDATATAASPLDTSDSSLK